MEKTTAKLGAALYEGCVLKAASDSMHSGQAFTFDDTQQNFAGALGVASFGDIRL